MLRVLRPLKAIEKIPSIKIIVSCLLAALPMLGHVFVLCICFFIITGLIAIQLFGGQLRNRCVVREDSAFLKKRLLGSTSTTLLNEREDVVDGRKWKSSSSAAAERIYTTSSEQRRSTASSAEEHGEQELLRTSEQESSSSSRLFSTSSGAIHAPWRSSGTTNDHSDADQDQDAATVSSNSARRSSSVNSDGDINPFLPLEFFGGASSSSAKSFVPHRGQKKSSLRSGLRKVAGDTYLDHVVNWGTKDGPKKIDRTNTGAPNGGVDVDHVVPGGMKDVRSFRTRRELTSRTSSAGEHTAPKGSRTLRRRRAESTLLQKELWLRRFLPEWLLSSPKDPPKTVPPEFSSSPRALSSAAVQLPTPPNAAEADTQYLLAESPTFDDVFPLVEYDGEKFRIIGEDVCSPWATQDVCEEGMVDEYVEALIQEKTVVSGGDPAPGGSSSSSTSSGTGGSATSGGARRASAVAPRPAKLTNLNPN